MTSFNLNLFSVDFISTLSEYFAYPFVRYALAVAVMISLCSALLGVSLVLKRFSMIGDGLSHVAFGASAVAAVFNVISTWIALPVTVLTAVFLLGTGKQGKNKKIKGDAAIAMLSAGALALGYLLLNITDTSSSNLSGDVCSSLFGSTSILTLTSGDVISCAALTAAVVLIYLLFYNRIFSVTFDERFAGATGIHVGLYNLITGIITAVVIVMGMKLAGALLISALIIFPPMSAMRMFRSFRAVSVASALISILCSAIGVVFSVLLETPVGASIVAVNILVFALSLAVGKLRRVRIHEHV